MTTKTILNSQPLDCVWEMLWRSDAIRWDRDFVAIDLRNFSPTHGLLEVQGLSQAADGRHAVYRGTARYPYRKASLARLLSADIAMGLNYPVGFELFQRYFQNSYDFLILSGEMEFQRGGVWVPFVEGDVLDATPDGARQITLRVANTSLRFLGAETWKIQLTGTP